LYKVAAPNVKDIKGPNVMSPYTTRDVVENPILLLYELKSTPLQVPTVDREQVGLEEVNIHISPIVGTCAGDQFAATLKVPGVVPVNVKIAI
jgi:hypothetical protein